MTRPIVQLTLAEFLDGYMEGNITECVSVIVATKQRVYGRDPRGMESTAYLYKIVWCEV
jgi:hypothetical protein